MRVLQPDRKISGFTIKTPRINIYNSSGWSKCARKSLIKATNSFNSCANESKGDKVPDVKIIEPTSILGNASKAMPGLKHHQLSVLDALPEKEKQKHVTKMAKMSYIPVNGEIIFV